MGDANRRLDACSVRATRRQEKKRNGRTKPIRRAPFGL